MSAFANMGIGGTLFFDARPGLSGMDAARGGFARLSSVATAFAGKIGSVAKSVLTLGGPLGQLASVAAVGMLAKSAVDASEEFESLQTVLGTTLSVVGKMDIASGLKLARSEMEKIEELAVKAPGSSADLLNIYKQIVSPMSVAGESLDKVRELTLSSSIAAQSLGLNFQDMGFGLGKMLSGTIQQDDLFYKMLRGMGLIKMGSMEWNAQTPVERIRKANELLGQFGKASDVVGGTWAAIKSTFGDVLTITKRAVVAPLFEALKGAIGGINDSFLNNKQGVLAWADSVGKRLIPAFQGVVTVAKAIASGWDKIQYGISSVWDFISGLVGPIIVNAKSIFAPFQEGAQILWHSIRLLINEIMALFGAEESSARDAGEGIGSALGAIINVIGEVFKAAAQVVGYVVSFIAHLRYFFEWTGTRIGEVFGVVYITIKNVFKGLYNAITEPVRNAIDFVRMLIEGLASTSIGRKAFETVGINVEATIKEMKGLTGPNGALGRAEFDGYADFRHVETPEERLARAEKARQERAKLEANVNVKVEPQTVNVNMNGKQVAEAVVKHQTEVQERAGAKDTQWQRRAAVVRATR